MKISAQKLVDFASDYRAEGILPELIRRLIRASSDRIEDVLFPSGESTFRPGADGELQAIGKAPYVPDGASIWELSTELKPHAKGRRDFKKRSGATAKKKTYMGKPRSDITYVAVSMRRWNTEKKVDRQDFIDAAVKGGVWKDVKVIDADHLEDWLDRTPSVSAWLAREMGLNSGDMKSIEQAWDEYSKGCSPQLSTTLLLANRKEKAEALVLAGLEPGVTRFKADSPGEAAAFVEAAILSLPENDFRRSALLAKGLVISDPESKRFITDTENKLFIIAAGRAVDIANELSLLGHTVIVPYGNSHSSSRGGPLVELPRARRHEFAEALVGMSMTEEKARIAAGAAHCSITVHRRASDEAQAHTPEWATPRELRKLVGPLCCGAWNHESDADKSIVSQIGGATYPEIDQAIQDVLLVDDAPLLRAGTLTTLSAPADIWQLSIDKKVVNNDLLQRFRAAAIVVLGEVDPALELPLDKRAYAEIYGKKRIYSGWLRKGIAEVLRLIAVNEDKLGYIHGFSAQRFVDDLLKDLPGLAHDYRMLASLDSLLPDLAEAAPIPFLNALEALMADDGAMLSPIFEGSDDPIFGRTYYMGTLRALEMLSWDPTQLMRTTRILARLAQLDPGGRLTNRPVNSLAEIFLPWNPSTNAQAPLRHKALSKLCEAFPDIGWTLLTKLLPDSHRISVGSRKPEWREVGASERPTPTYGSRDADHDLAFGLARPLAGVDASRWLELIKAAGESRNTPQFLALLDEIDIRANEFVVAGQGKLLWEGLRELISRHQGFATANWAMSQDMVERMQRSANALQPNDLISLHRHLFNNTLIDHGSPVESFDERSKRSGQRRDDAIADIAKGGVDEILRLAREVKTPGLLAPSLVRATSPEFCAEVIRAAYNGDGPLAWLASLTTSCGAALFGPDWGMGVVDQIQASGATPNQIAILLKAWDDTPQLFDYVASKDTDIQEQYWAHRDIYVRTEDPVSLDLAIEKLSSHGRNAELIEFLGARLKTTDTALLVQVLDRALKEVLEDPQHLRHVDSYWLGEIFKALRVRSDVDREALMGLEYRWLPAFHSYTDQQELVLHEHIGQSPEFFIEVLSDLYKADWEVKDSSGEDEDVGEEDVQEHTQDTISEPIDSQKHAKADIAYKILDSWRKLPWLAEDGAIDYDAMLAWSQSVLALGKEKGRYGVAAREMGKLLAYAPVDKADKVWPAREVRDLVEELADEELESGLVTELYNKRGVHARPMDGGGSLERDLAAAASKAADALQGEWPRTSNMLRDNAKQWISHAEWQDRKAAEQRISL